MILGLRNMLEDAAEFDGVVPILQVRSLCLSISVFYAILSAALFSRSISLALSAISYPSSVLSVHFFSCYDLALKMSCLRFLSKT